MGATFGRIKNFIDGDTILASETNAEFNNILTNLTPAGVDDQSTNDAAMQATADPYPAAVIDKPTDLKGELERLRYVIKQITGQAQWYVDPDYSIAGGTVIADTISEKTSAAGVTIDSCLIKDGGVAAVSDGTNIIKTKIINIGTWDMDTTANVSVAHGVTLSKIREVSVLIRNNADTERHPLGGTCYSSSATFTQGGSFYVTSTNIVMARITATSQFDNTNYDTMGDDGNRGWITITYIV